LPGYLQKFAACSDEEPIVRVWDMGLRKQLRLLRGHTGRVTALCPCSPTGEKGMATASIDCTVRVWRDPTKYNECLRVLCGHTGPVYGVVHLGNGRVVSAGEDQLLRVWGEQGEVEKEIKGHSDRITCLGLLYEKGDLISGARGGSGVLADNTVRCWGTQTEDHRHRYLPVDEKDRVPSWETRGEGDRQTPHRYQAAYTPSRTVRFLGAEAAAGFPRA